MCDEFLCKIFISIVSNSATFPEGSQPKQQSQPIQGALKLEKPPLQKPLSQSTPSSSSSQIPQSIELVQTSSVFCSPPIISSVITTEEIILREQQVIIAKELERYQKRLYQAGLSGHDDVIRLEHFRLNCEIVLLQAKQLVLRKKNLD